jgi:hypothetical protein
MIVLKQGAGQFTWVCSKVLLGHNHSHLFPHHPHLHLCYSSREVVATEAAGPAKPHTPAVCPFAERVFTDLASTYRTLSPQWVILPLIVSARMHNKNPKDSLVLNANISNWYRTEHSFPWSREGVTFPSLHAVLCSIYIHAIILCLIYRTMWVC